MEEEEHQRRTQDKEKESEVKSIEDKEQEEKEELTSDLSEGKNLSNDSNNGCDNTESDIEDAKKEVLAHLLGDIDLRYNLGLKRNILGSFEKYHEKSMDLLKKLILKKASLQDELEEK